MQHLGTICDQVEDAILPMPHHLNARTAHQILVARPLTLYLLTHVNPGPTASGSK